MMKMYLIALCCTPKAPANYASALLRASNAMDTVWLWVIAIVALVVLPIILRSFIRWMDTKLPSDPQDFR